ncbi:hypothetical protein B9479_000903 [Cryptococcus floricola]|uniref:Uncharacterized protein n=1 Tax=Cryptococcus floricola TaxID=2591691 RepID=A0A5D3B3R5_9TREE|nr:hypothetical protein B9479_000903 [Cryptococcus floricola]
MLPSLRAARPLSTLAFPHPALAAPNGHTRFALRAFESIPSLAHAYAILRAAENKLGAKALHVRIPKSMDSLKLGPSIHIETLRPVKLENQLLLEIPSPILSPESNFLGGLCLEDVAKSLDSDPVISTSVQKSPSNGRKDRPLQFKIEVSQPPSRNPSKSRRSASFRSKQGGKEGAEVVQALKAFEGGFYGGFEGVADKFEGMLAAHTKPRRGNGETASGDEA